MNSHSISSSTFTRKVTLSFLKSLHFLFMFSFQFLFSFKVANTKSSKSKQKLNNKKDVHLHIYLLISLFSHPFIYLSIYPSIRWSILFLIRTNILGVYILHRIIFCLIYSSMHIYLSIYQRRIHGGLQRLNPPLDQWTSEI